LLHYTTHVETLQTHTHTHTHTHSFNGPLSGTTRVSRYQKVKTNLDFTEARDSQWRWHQLGRMQACTSLQTDNHASTHHSVFTDRMPFLPPNQYTLNMEPPKPLDRVVTPARLLIGRLGGRGLGVDYWQVCGVLASVTRPRQLPHPSSPHPRQSFSHDRTY